MVLSLQPFPVLFKCVLRAVRGALRDDFGHGYESLTPGIEDKVFELAPHAENYYVVVRTVFVESVFGSGEESKAAVHVTVAVTEVVNKNFEVRF